MFHRWDEETTVYVYVYAYFNKWLFKVTQKKFLPAIVAWPTDSCAVVPVLSAHAADHTIFINYVVHCIEICKTKSEIKARYCPYERAAHSLIHSSARKCQWVKSPKCLNKFSIQFIWLLETGMFNWNLWLNGIGFKTSDKLRWIKLHTLVRRLRLLFIFTLDQRKWTEKQKERIKKSAATANSRSTIYRLFGKPCSDQIDKHFVVQFELCRNMKFLDAEQNAHLCNALFVRLFVSNVTDFFSLAQFAKYAINVQSTFSNFKKRKWKMSRNHPLGKHTPNLVGNFLRFQWIY